MWKVILLCAFVGITAGEFATYENYTLFHVTPQIDVQIKFLQSYYKFAKPHAYDLWNVPNREHACVNIMVHTDFVEDFKMRMTYVNLNFISLEDYVQTLINLTTKKGQSSSFDFTNYHTLEEIYKNLDDLAEMYPENVKIIVGGSTYEGRQIKGVKISFKPNNPGVFLEGGINAREWMAPAVVMYIIHQLLSSNDTHTRNTAESYDWYIFPVFNPDGYVYTHTTDRMWTKTRKPYNNTIGSNPNKNWDYKWNGNIFGSKSNMFAGPEPFSEVETKSMSEYIESIKDKFFAYFSFHSHSPDLTYPPDDFTNNTKQYDSDMSITKFIFHEYGFKNVFKTIDLDRGSSITYVKGTYNKPLVLAYGLQDIYSLNGFLQSPKLIVKHSKIALYDLENILENTKYYSYDKYY
ncbi:zinc carboxypeptidase-like isoform X2 [Odontomachus brunneus]|uniref:zinc carboxypeptidase-like isoform X2 n=1 Tax=Odontomachus brunneus TaxID=486640 RepID=UPI0013F26393|nr:zinc carboxypeptidase-like isoform X2 [Odontomachus brunneus]